MNELTFALRQLWKNPGFSLIAVITFALGIGLVSTQFSLIDAILLRGLPIDGAQRLVHISRLDPQSKNPDFWLSTPYRDYLAFREQQTTLESVAAYTMQGFNIAGDGRVPSHHSGAFGTANLLDVLGVKPQLGRWFEPGETEAGQALLAVLSHGLWQSRFGGDPAVLGKSIRINGENASIVGVMPPRFTFPLRQDLWANMRAKAQDPRETDSTHVEMMGKLREGVGLAEAAAEFQTIAQRLTKLYPETNAGFDRMNVEKFAYAYSGTGTVPILYIMLAMTAFILALACVNVANMLLARAARRTRELAVRTAIGASRWQLIRQLLIESVMFAMAGALGGLVIAQIGVVQLQHQIVERMNAPGWFDFRLDHRVLLFAVGATVLAGLLAGIFPAWQAARFDVNAALKDESRGAAGLRLGRWPRWLVTAQIGFSSALLVSACILGATVYEVRQANLQYDPDQLLFSRIELHDSTHATPEDRSRFYHALLERLASEPGVEGAAVTSRDLIQQGVVTRVAIEGAVYQHENEQPNVLLEVVSNGYFSLFGQTARSGRLFDRRDQPGTPRAAVINESFARKFWLDADPLGRRFRSQRTGEDWVTVVGVVPDLQMQGLFSPPNLNSAGFYLSQDQTGWGWLYLFVRSQTKASELAGAIRQAVASLDPDQPVHTIDTLAAQTARQINGFKVVGVMAGIFAVITLFLGGVGVYGVTSFAVNRRTREFGVRMALGATVSHVLGMVIRQGTRQIVVGLLGGLTVAFFITRPMASVLGEEIINSPAVYALVVSVISAVGVFAMWLPARRAARIDPMEALRNE